MTSKPKTVEQVCHNCEVFQKFLNSTERPLACETARAVGKCSFQKILDEVDKLRSQLKLLNEHGDWLLEKKRELEGRLTAINEILKEEPQYDNPKYKPTAQGLLDWRFDLIKWLERLREASSDSEKLTPQEEADVSESLKEIGEGKAKKFTNADAMIRDLKRRGRKP